jgi:hypothetical protein
MIRFVLAVLIWVVGPVPVLAQSSLLDFSKPMSGKSRFVVNPDGSPLELGAPARRESQQASAPAVACDGGPCGSGADPSAQAQVDDQSGTDGRSGEDDQSGKDGQSRTDGQSGKDEQSGKDDPSEKAVQSEQTTSPASQGEAGDAVQDRSFDQ